LYCFIKEKVDNSLTRLKKNKEGKTISVFILGNTPGSLLCYAMAWILNVPHRPSPHTLWYWELVEPLRGWSLVRGLPVIGCMPSKSCGALVSSACSISLPDPLVNNFVLLYAPRHDELLDTASKQKHYSIVS
jgi:hypothetical protein